MNKVVLNSLALYANMAVTMIVTLLGVRYVLDVLGKEEYGVYMLISSIVLLFSFINVGMAASTQRFLSFDLGRGAEGEIKETFYTSLVIHLSIATLITVLLLLVGSFFIQRVLAIPPALLGSAHIVLACMTGGIVFTVLAAPYEGAMNAHEDIYVIAGINILEAVLKLAAALSLFLIEGDRLVVYALLIMLVQGNSFLLKRAYSRRRYAETHYRFHRPSDTERLKHIARFAGWSLVGQGASIGRFQGVSILLNVFFGVAVNAAYGIAQQIFGFLLFFAGSIVRPLRPLIVKKEGAGLHDDMVRLAFTACRFPFLLLSFVIIPLFVNMPLVLDVWLTEVPDGALMFSRAMLIAIILNQLTIGLEVAIDSVERIKRLHLIIGALNLSPLLIGYVLFRFGFPPAAIFWTIIAEEAVAVTARTFIAKRETGLSAAAFFRRVALPCLAVVALSFFATLLLAEPIAAPLPRLIATTFFSATLTSFLAYRFCLSEQEKTYLKNITHAVKQRFLHDNNKNNHIH